MVDDDPDIADSISDVLRAGGYEPLSAGDGVSALEFTDVALVLLDWRLPQGPSGAPLVRQLRERHGAALPIVVLSADPLSLSEAQKAQVTDYLPKPFEVADLLHLIDQYCPQW